MDKVEEFIRLLYAVSESSLGAQRLNKFRKSTDDDLRKLPPSREALLQLTKRACYQARYLWQECESDLNLPDPKVWGWTFNEDRGLIPSWLTVTSTIDLEKSENVRDASVQMLVSVVKECVDVTRFVNRKRKKGRK